MSDNSITNKKRIAKNTVFLYIRMIITMVVSLFTTRVVLHTLGVEDYGIYQTIGGFVMLLGYLNGALSAGSSRFLTYELGTGNTAKLRDTFSSVFWVHLIFAGIVLFIGETVGLWFVYEKLNIPETRMSAAIWAYHLSIVTTVFTITQVPYSASIISHERMNVYAYTSVIDAILKLIIVYLIIISPIDKLVFYSILLFVQSVGMMCFYRWYCVHRFSESSLKAVFDKTIVKSILSYSGWNVFATTSVALCSQGLTVITNMFFNPGVVAARAVANTVNQTATQFVNNFRTAVNPQIVKQYAAQNYDGSKALLLSSTKYSFYLFYLIALPVCLSAEFILQLWLGQVPEYAVQYLQLAIATSLFGVFDLSFYTGLYAKGQIRENSIISSSFFFIAFVLTFVLFKLGMSPLVSGWMLLISQTIIALVVKPVMLVKIVNYNYRELFKVFKNCFLVSFVSAPLPIITMIYKDDICDNYYLRELIVCLFAIICALITIWFVGFDKEMRQKLIGVVRSKLTK